MCVYRLSDAENMFLFILDSNDIGDEPNSLSFLHMELELVFSHFIPGTDDVQLKLILSNFPYLTVRSPFTRKSRNEGTKSDRRDDKW